MKEVFLYFLLLMFVVAYLALVIVTSGTRQRNKTTIIMELLVCFNIVMICEVTGFTLLSIVWSVIAGMALSQLITSLTNSKKAEGGER